MPAGKRAKSSPEINACKTIMRHLFSKRYKHLAWIFYDPIEPEVLGLTDYHQIVKEPMDLTTVKYRLGSNFYTHAVDFARDIRLIFYNAYLYTNPGHLCYDMAKELQLIFEEMYAKVPLPQPQQESCEWSDDSSSELDVERVSCSSADSSPVPTKQNIVAPVIRVEHPMYTLHDWKCDGLELPMTTEEDLELHIRVQQLDGLMLLNVIHMIHQLEGLNFKYPNKELEFDVRNLKTHTKRSILAYMASKGITGKRVSRLKRTYQ
ncbi:hypothetical protein KR222_008470 [Zaprionus bogoriensis]|nr:hypothetical protein KR222_008470 [Zaprionus bogoriensis]